MAKDIDKPHDNFCKAALSDIRVAKSVLSKHLPAEISAMVNFDTLEVTNATFINEHLRKQESDILFKADIAGKVGYLYILLEHQSSPDKLMPVRLFRYMAEILNTHLNNHADNASKQLPLPPVFPIVIYNGNRPYNYSKNLFSLFGEYGDLMQRVFCDDFKLIDLSTIPDTELKQDIWGGLMCFLMKHIYAADSLPYLEEIQDSLQLIEHQGGGKLLISMLTYVISTGSISDDDRLHRLLRKALLPKTGAEIMTYAKKLEARGEVIGEANGRLAEKYEIARKLLVQGASIGDVSRLVTLSSEQIKSLKAKLTEEV